MQAIYTVTQINNHSKSIIESNFNNIWIKGEISTVNNYKSGHVYLILKDHLSELSCVIFNYNKNDLSVGTLVTINGKLSIYTAKGKYQFIIKNIYLSGGGELWNKYLTLKKKLLKEGLFNNNIKLKLPKYPSTIGLITSIDGAVVNDVINILQRRYPPINIIISDTVVQGENCPMSVIKSLRKFEKYNKVDFIIIARGGGSLEDLMSFNNEKLIREIFNINIPVISAIGHETDFTLCDFVSDVRASTPSEAAEISVPDINELLIHADYLQNNIYEKIFNQMIANKKN